MFKELYKEKSSLWRSIKMLLITSGNIFDTGTDHQRKVCCCVLRPRERVCFQINMFCPPVSNKLFISNRDYSLLSFKQYQGRFRKKEIKNDGISIIEVLILILILNIPLHESDVQHYSQLHPLEHCCTEQYSAVQNPLLNSIT